MPPVGKQRRWLAWLEKTMENPYKPLPFWSWNDDLDDQELIQQIDWFHSQGIGGFFMHARSGLKIPYLSEEWFSKVNLCSKHANELGMQAFVYDEYGWPSGFVGGKLPEDGESKGYCLEHSFGTFDPSAYACYDCSGEEMVRVSQGESLLRVYLKRTDGYSDTLNPEVVRKFIRMTHEEYKKHDECKCLRGFFTDEPQFPIGGHPYSPCLEGYFQEHYEEDIRDFLGLLFVKKKGYEEFRYRFWLSMNNLFVHNYGKQIYDWCHENNYLFTGHYYEETVLWLQTAVCGDIMPLYRYMDIPGVDWLGRQIQYGSRSDRAVASVAAQYGKKQVITEIFAMVGWDCTPRELKRLAEYHFAGGVNLICHHLVPFHEHGQRKRDFPEHFSVHSPWVAGNFREFNDHLASLGKKLGESEEPVHVGVFYPIRSCYLNFDNENRVESVRELEESLDQVISDLTAKHIPYHFLDEMLLAEDGRVENNRLCLGRCTYDAVVFPKTYILAASTDKLLREYVRNGGRVLLLDEKPFCLEGQAHSFDYLVSNVSLDDLVRELPYRLEENRDLLMTYRKETGTGRSFFFIVNLGDEAETVLNGHRLFFSQYESKLIYEDELTNEKAMPDVVVPEGPYHLVRPLMNALTIDMLSFSEDGVHYSEPLFHMGVQDVLMKKHYDGDLFLKYAFDADAVPAETELVIENTNVKSVIVNGRELKEHEMLFEKDIWKFSTLNLFHEGRNEIVMKIHFSENESLYRVLENRKAPESLLNCLVYETTIEPVYVLGEFGVYGDFRKGTEPGCYLGKDFRIGKQKDEIHSMILDGFPFYRGKYEIETTVHCSSDNAVLLLPNRFQLVDVTVNGVAAGRMMLSDRLDISGYVHEGGNHLVFTVYTSNRNLLGPHHCPNAEEEKAVSPYSFEFRGTYENGHSRDFREEYTFVENIL